MAGYWIAFVEVHDPAGQAEYGKLARDVIARHGGALKCRGTKSHVPEGPAERGNAIVVEFPTYQAALDCYNSADYQKAIPLRQKASHGRLMVVGDE
jgi:uncharacterized protein (DUF1330 family)